MEPWLIHEDRETDRRTDGKLWRSKRHLTLLMWTHIKEKIRRMRHYFWRQLVPSATSQLIYLHSTFVSKDGLTTNAVYMTYQSEINILHRETRQNTLHWECYYVWRYSRLRYERFLRLVIFTPVSLQWQACNAVIHVMSGKMPVAKHSCSWNVQFI